MMSSEFRPDLLHHKTSPWYILQRRFRDPTVLRLANFVHRLVTDRHEATSYTAVAERRAGRMPCCTVNSLCII